MSVDFIVRLIGMCAFSVGGMFLGMRVGEAIGGDVVALWGTVFALLGALTGLVLTPYLTTRPIRAMRSQMFQLSARTIMAGLVGMVAGLVVAALVSFPLSLLPRPFGQWLPFVGAIVFTYLGVSVSVARQNDIMGMLRNRFARVDETGEGDMPSELRVLLDTSVIIDGRLVDIARTGFLNGALLVPSFVLAELQAIADSPDSLRRQRGRRGLDILNQLQKDKRISLRITDLDVEGVRSVDDKLVILAKQLRCPILTNDYNLNRVAELQGLSVLNTNDLANAVKAVFLPGEALEVHIIQEGKEVGQGVGFLDDGTMVVVEGGKEHIDSTVPVVVTKVLQTAAGRMIFARPSPERVSDGAAE